MTKLLAALAIVVVLLVAGGVVVWRYSGARLVADRSALGRVELQRFAGSLVSVRARTGDGRAIPVAVAHGRLLPRVAVDAGQRVFVSVVVERPRWSRWAL